MENEFVANKALAEEIRKRFVLLEAASNHLNKQNYGIVRKLLNKLLYGSYNIIVYETENTKEQAGGNRPGEQD